MNETLIGVILVVAFLGAVYYIVRKGKKNKPPTGPNTGDEPPRNPPTQEH